MAKGKNGVVFLAAHGTALRPLNKETDLDAALRWVNDPDIMDLLGARAMPMTRIQEAAWFDNLGEDDRKLNLAITEASSGRLIGSIGLHQIDFMSRVASMGILIGEKRFWGKGHGTNATMLLLKHCFYRLNLHKVCWEAVAFNDRSVACAKRCGFQLEGRRIEHMFRQGTYVDQLEFGLFRSPWASIFNRWFETGSVK